MMEEQQILKETPDNRRTSDAWKHLMIGEHQILEKRLITEECLMIDEHLMMQ